MFTLRPARKCDLAPIRRLILRVRINPSAVDWKRFTVAEDSEGKFIGCGQVKPHRDGSRELASVAVVPEWQGRGVGSALSWHLMQTAGPPLWLMCRSGLAPYYARMGFREVRAGEPQPRYFARVRRLATVTSMLARQGEVLAVMLWKGNEGGR